MENKMAKPKKYTELPERSHPDYMKLYNEINKDKLKVRRKSYRKKRLEDNPDFYKDEYAKRKDKHMEYRAANKSILCEKQWLSRGILDFSYEKFEKELQKQERKCAICGCEMTKPQVDHDHKTGKYRGILCIPCNNGLGVYENKKHLFDDYLKRTS